MGLGMACAVLHIGAHPDDEDIGLLAYSFCKFGARGVYWSATRGEGGQNRIGPYKEEALGIYRTWESLDARSHDGGESLFGPFYDFGYSKNAEEAFAKWGRRAMIREIVRAIRLIQPHIVVSRWTGTPIGHHGHHQAVGQAAQEAFEVAGDPNQYTELKAQGLAAWQPLKFYHSMDNSGGDLTSGGALNLSGLPNPELERDGILRINTGEFDPIAGSTYQERAWIAYNEHKTQAMGLAPGPGDFFYYFYLQKSLVSVPKRETSFFDGLDPSLTGLADHLGNGSPFLRNYLEEIKDRTREALRDFRADDPIEASTSLLEGLSLLRETSARLEKADLDNETKQAFGWYLARKIKDFEKVTARCLGLELECLSGRSRIIPGEQFQVSSSLWNHRGTQIDKTAFALCLPEGWQARSLEPQEAEGTSPAQSDDGSLVLLRSDFEITAAERANFTCPYWLVKPREPYHYHWPRGGPCSLPFAPSPIKVNCEVALGGHRITLQEAVIHRESFPGGFRELPLAVIPPISLDPKTSCEFLPLRDAEQSLELQAVVRNNRDQTIEGDLELVVPPGWGVTPGSIYLSLPEGGGTETVQHEVTIPSDVQADRYVLQYRIRCGKLQYGVVLTSVRMQEPGLPALADESNCVKEEFIVTPSEVTVHLIDVKFVEGLHYAYVQGVKEELLDTLKPFGIRFHLVTDAEVGYLDLSKFDAVVIGPNAYLMREELRQYASRFLEYVKQGGTLIVQYQGYRYQTSGFTPYPFGFNEPHDRVTHEDAPVKILDPNHVLFRLPNPIDLNDFDGWTRERGLYFFGWWDKQYHALLSSSDPGEEPKEGGLIECQYGPGTFLYTGYSFFRQLPAGIPGAFHLFANILALPEARILERIEFLKKISLFSLLTDEQLDAVARIMSERRATDGAYVCRQGEVGEELYIVYRGELEILRESSNQEQFIDVAKEGDCVGELAILGNIPRTASLRARGDVRLLIIEGSHFLELLQENPEMSIRLLKLLVNRLAPTPG
jgi:LmbE family N-acetylglucosaminyl deacetylase